MALRLHLLVSFVLLAAAAPTALPAEARATMTPYAYMTPAYFQDKDPAALTELHGPPETVEFTLDDGLTEFRIPLLNKFTKTQIASGDIRLLEATYALDDKYNLTVWFQDANYVDHYVYDKMTDF